MIWDIYLENSLKMTTRQKCSDGSRKKVTGTAIMSRIWDRFSRNSQKKYSLFQSISNCIKSKLFPGLKQKKKMVTTYNGGIFSSDGNKPATPSPCNHENGGYRALLHCQNMSKERVNQAMIFTADTDVVVIATSVFSELSLLEL